MIEVGIIGAGFMGKVHAQAYAKIPEVNVAFVVARTKEHAQSLAVQIGAKAETDIEAVLRDPAIDLVDLSVPTPLHKEFAVRTFEAGKHVVIEKPLALSLPEADAIIEAAERSGKFLMVAHVLRFWPEYLAILALVQSEELGKPLLATAQRLSNMPQWATWFRDPEATGGAVLDLHIHDLDMMNWLFGQPKDVFATGIQGETGGWDHVLTSINYETVRTSIEASSMMPLDFPFTTGLRITCERGVIEYSFRAGGASFESGEPTHSLLVHKPGTPYQPLPFDERDAFENELAYFVNCVRSGKPPSIVTPEDARLALQTSLAARESLETGKVVSLLE